MAEILTIGAVLIAVLLTVIVFLSWKLRQANKSRNSYDVMEKSQLVQQQQEIPSRAKFPIIATQYTQWQSDLKSKQNFVPQFESAVKSDLIKQQHSPTTKQSDRIELLSQSDTGSSPLVSQTDLSVHSMDIPKSPITGSHEASNIHFKLVYVTETSAIKVHINRVNNLPLQFRKNCSSFVKVSLNTNSKEKLQSHHTNVIKNSLNPEFDEVFTFSAYNYLELNHLTIRLAVYARRKQLSKRQLVGDLWIPLSRPDLEPDGQIACTETLSLACPNTGKRGALIMVGKLGYLYVQLQYQPEAERLKVIVRKAQNIYNQEVNKSAVQIVQPEYYVIVSLLGGDNEVVIYKETKCAIGVSPIWNQPFLLNVPALDRNQYHIQFLVMKGKFYTKDGAVGQVLIGPNTTPTGIDHWNEIIRSGIKETAKWHEIKYIGTHCF